MHFPLTASFLLTPSSRWIFIPADILSLLLQGIGGALSAGGSSPALLQTGTNIAIAGICFQVFSLVIFGLLATTFFARVWRARQASSKQAASVVSSPSFRAYAVATLVAYLTILIRCCYRIPELSGGWRNKVFTNQIEFIVLEGVMIAVATIALTAVHPGYFFPSLATPMNASLKQTASEGTISSEEAKKDVDFV